MDPRVSTAPSPGGKKWTTKTNAGSSSCLLRRSSVKPVKKPRDEDSEEARPNTCPVPTLTPQFHWNLNNSALKTLTRNQIDQLYGLFTFYDSSTTGDNLPSINCARLIEVLRDARLLHESCSGSIMPSTRGLNVESVQRIFAQAVMGKMRVYLDADGEPALTFPLFCGALMNCAMLLTPLAHPEAALRQILPVLLESSIVSGHRISADTGILGLFPADGAISLWTLGDLHPHPSTGRQHDFRDLPPFQQVIADCASDKALEERNREKLTKCYQIPDHLIASFHRDTIAVISNKFQMFDVFDRGTVPRQEVFPLLSSVGRHPDLPDPYAVLAKLAASNGLTSEMGGEMTLAQLLQAIEAARDSRRYSITARLAAMKIANNPDRNAEDDTTLASKPGLMSTTIQDVANDGTNIDDLEHAANSQDTPPHSHASLIKERGKKMRATRSRRSITSQTPGAGTSGSSPHALIINKHRGGSKNRLNHLAPTSIKKKSEMHRKLSTKGKLNGIVTTDSDNHGLVMHSMESSPHSQCSTSSISSKSSSDDDHEITATTGSFTPRSEDLNIDQRNSKSFEHNDKANAVSTRAHEPPRSSKTLHIFLLLGGDHDGAICCSLSLNLATREIVESEGIHYSIAPSETTRTTPVLPTQTTLMNALLLLKKSVAIKQGCGFELRPTNQLEVVDEMLLELKKQEPRFSMALKPGMRASITATSPINLSPTNANILGVEKEEESVSSSPLGMVPAMKIVPPSILRRRRNRRSPFKPENRYQFKLPNNYRDILATWEVSQSDNYAWVHAVTAASPLKPASPLRSKTRPHPSGYLSPLRFPK
ncbi:unnamed protein product [Phytophthora fragariaefolia]|uniref:Unnamed protein product n=1 Tax=Phytophthora fragariaefolia TaxID=1490495 RepID=A0A9W6XJ11_9STRA|nr:unnamed protein product [Phytophthora fragariaefolia]